MRIRKRANFKPEFQDLEDRKLLSGTRVLIDLDNGATPEQYSLGRMVDYTPTGQLTGANPATDQHGSQMANEACRYDSGLIVVSVNCSDANGVVYSNLLDQAAQFWGAWARDYQNQNPGSSVAISVPQTARTNDGYFVDMINQFNADGDKFAISAANDSQDNGVYPHYPANDVAFGSAGMTVAAAQSNGQLWSYSDYGRGTVNMAVTVPQGGGTSEACVLAADIMMQIDQSDDATIGHQSANYVVGQLEWGGTYNANPTITGRYWYTGLN